MPALPQLLHATEDCPKITAYNPNTFAYIPGKALDGWMKIFYDSIASFKTTAQVDSAFPPDVAAAQADNFAANYKAKLDALDCSTNNADLSINCLELCRLRETALIESGFTDIYLDIKRRENENALALFPEVLAELDAEIRLHARWDLVIRGICAANIFDLGAAHTADLYHSSGGISFHTAREQLLPRPWAVDNLDALIAKLTRAELPYKKALLFVDNSGADLILGMLPFARELLRQGCSQVVIAANELPSINDITAAELDALLPKIAAADDILCKAISTRRLIVVSSGNALPVIDLRDVSQEVVEVAGDADLVVLEGMGRGIETNLNAALRVDVLKIGMVKHPEVAAELQGRMLDCVVKFG